MTAELVTTPGRATMPDKIAYARELAQSGLLPASYRKQPANLLYAVEYGEMLNLSPMAAVTGVHVIEGKPSASAALISALVRRAGHRLRVTGDDTRATAEIVRADDPDFTFRAEWTIDRAKRANLLGKNTWKNYPAAMLKARAVTEVARDACEEALMGMSYTPEELGAEVDEDGIPTRPSPLAGTAQHTAAPVGEQEPDWAAQLADREEARDRAGLVALWKQAKAWHPDDADLLTRIEAAGARVKAAQDAADDVVDAELVDDEPPPDDAQRRTARMHALFSEAGLGANTPAVRARRLTVLSTLLGREVTTSKNLTPEDREQVIGDLERYQRDGDLDNVEARAQEDAEIARLATEEAEGGDEQ